MITLPAIRWGEPYESLEIDQVNHFYTGEPVAKVHTVGSGIIRRDAKKAKNARRALQAMSPSELIAACKRAGELFETGTLTVGDSQQSPDDFIQQQSATTGMPVSMCKANVVKNAFVLKNIDQILDCLTRGLDLNILARGYGEEGRGVTVSYQAQCDALGAVLPSNSPGVHTLWLPVIALQMGLVLKPGSSEPWTPYRVFAAMVEAGIPREAFCLYPGAGGDIGGAILASCRRSMIFGGPQTVQQYSGNPGVQVHGPGFSKILFGDDCADQWEQHIDLLADSALRNGGRSCINVSSIYASRHTKEIAKALAEKLGPVEVLPPDDENAQLAAFTIEGAAASIWKAMERDIDDPQTTHVTAGYGDRLVEKPPVAYLRPVVLHCASPEAPAANKEYMFPAVSVVECPQEKMLSAIGPTLVCTAITGDEAFRRDLIGSVDIDRLNLGAIPTPKLDWLQPHEGNLIEFLYRSRAIQLA
ncbi:Putative succinate-semialdehyde dehydrogenase [NADP(+)] 2 [Pirellulimonas nuda]|uniref:Succinate-semialdehyde dehydrogenase [NADP(+)] 2 n=1 Tax=Pirellulimonas nuda TaxID=2528009 RepID=A0A518DA28_9BACT|nr:aldehyde dehydrogenase family protein [Pirellulimonas nuda]QDU88303.1 Putative succinate-semialdehyde dehydrogenase [NADP(+)] 2 [Pirellulimonas nuda]